jgi:DNA-binding IclR family transcriptional regulator
MVRERGFATNNEESTKGLCGTAVPIKNPKSWCVAALSGSYLAGSLNKKEQNDLLERLLAGATEIEKIGFEEVDTNVKFAS